MADFALGLTKNAVEGTLSRVRSAIDEENKLRAAAQQDLVSITGEFQMMQAFLKGANKERARNEVVKAWVRQLRDLAFDVEDCVEFVVHLDNSSAWSWVWRMVPSCMAPHRARELDMAVAELKQLKERVVEVSQRNTRYNISSGSGSTPTTQENQLATAGPSTLDTLKELWVANMKRSGLCDLRKFIIDEGADRKVISIWTSAGAHLAAEHIISTTLSDPGIGQEFKVHARVKLMYPFNRDEFIKSLLTQLYESSDQEFFCDELRNKGDHVIQVELFQLLSKHKYLIIVEDLSSVVEWKFIKQHLPDIPNGSRIVISTEQLEVALACTGEPFLVSELRRFPDGRFLHAFFKANINMAELLRQIGERHRVISVWGSGDTNDTSKLVQNVYAGIVDKLVRFKEVTFEKYVWLDVPHPFNLEKFYWDFMITTGNDDDEDVEKFCQQASEDLCSSPTVVVINGLQSTKDWELIKETFVPDGTKSCIVVIAKEAGVAKYFTDVFTEENNNMAELLRKIGERHRVISVWGAGDNDTSKLVRYVYGGIADEREGFKGVNFEAFLWLDVPLPFKLENFYRYMMTKIGTDGEDFEKFRQQISRDLCSYPVLVVINGLQSTKDWELIKETFVPDGTKSCIIVIAKEAGVAKYCENHSPIVVIHEEKEANAAICPFREVGTCYSLPYGSQGSQILLSNRVEEAFRVPFIESQNDMRWALHFHHVCKYGVNTVWGTIGVGKSALVRCSYYEEIIRSMEYPSYLPDGDDLYRVKSWGNKFRMFGWVHVPDPFDLAEFSRRLFLDFRSLDPQQMETTAVGIIQGNDPIQGCYEILRNNKCLLVIDGLRSTHEWDSIEEALLCELPPKYSVVVITIEESVAKHCVRHNKDHSNAMFNVRALDDAAASVLYKKIADGKQELNSINLECAKHIVPKCGGLPKIISSVAQASGSFWENVNDDLIVKFHTDKQFHSLSGLLSWMHSYFDACSDSVKPCVFYLSVFPTNYKIRKGRLIRRWITEGYSRDAIDRTAKENAEKLFSELVKLGMIQQPASNGMCQVNGFFREYIISQPMEDNLVFALEGHCKLNSQRTGQHLTIMNSWEKDKNVFESIDVSRLRSMTVFGKWQPFFLSEKMKRIRVLDLEGTSDVNDTNIGHIFGKLLSLKFVSLRGCRNITCLPNTLGGLKQLETLDVRCTSVVTLPPVIIKLHKIQYIRAGSIVSSDEDWTSTPLEDNDGTVSNHAPVTAPAEGSDGMAESPPPQPAISPESSHDTKPMPQNMAWTPKLSCTSMLHPSRLLKCPPASRGFCASQRKSKHVRAHNAGVEVPVGIVKMAALHTLGVVNINSVRGNDFLANLSELTQLLKLRLCGINRENWQELCLALSSLGHLESLSMRLEEACLEDPSFQPPKTLKSLKLYGPIHKLPIWIKELVNLRKLDLEIIVSTTKYFSVLVDELPYNGTLSRLCIKPTQEITKLYFDTAQYFFRESYIYPRVLKIDCVSELEVTFNGSILFYLEVLIIHCSRGSSFHLSSQWINHGLEKLESLKASGFLQRGRQGAPEGTC